MNAIRMIVGAAALLALTGGTAAAQGRGHGRGREGAPGQLKKEGRYGEERYQDPRSDAWRFDGRQRELARNWYFHERRGGYDLPPGLRDRDRLPPGLAARFRPGYVIEPEWRERLYPAPFALIRVFPPPPLGYRYMLFGGDLVLVDTGYRVADIVGLELNFGY